MATHIPSNRWVRFSHISLFLVPCVSREIGSLVPCHGLTPLEGGGGCSGALVRGELRRSDGGDSYGGGHDRSGSRGRTTANGRQVRRVVMVKSEVWRKGLV